MEIYWAVSEVKRAAGWTDMTFLTIMCLIFRAFYWFNHQNEQHTSKNCVFIKWRTHSVVTFLKSVLVGLTCTDLTSISPSSFPLMIVLSVPLILSALCKAFVCQSVQYTWVPTITSPYGWGISVTTTRRSCPDRSELSIVLHCPSFQYKRPAGLSIVSPLGQPKPSDINVNLKTQVWNSCSTSKNFWRIRPNSWIWGSHGSDYE